MPGLTFNTSPGDVQQPAAELSAPFQDNVAKPTQPQIPLHDKRPKESSGLQPNRDQVYKIKDTSKFNFRQFTL